MRFCFEWQTIRPISSMYIRCPWRCNEKRRKKSKVMTIRSTYFSFFMFDMFNDKTRIMCENKLKKRARLITSDDSQKRTKKRHILKANSKRLINVSIVWINLSQKSVNRKQEIQSIQISKSHIPHRMCDAWEQLNFYLTNFQWMVFEIRMISFIHSRLYPMH